MELDAGYVEGQTPLDPDERQGLLISTISTRGELDEHEQLNIEEAIAWLHGRTFKAEDILNEEFIKTVHGRMYGDVWSWAGTFRTTNKNLGPDKWQIPTQLDSLLRDATYWYRNDTYSPDECVIRFKHRLVSIHCFPNGNGRHSRLLADLLIEKVYKLKPFTWGAGMLVQPAEQRVKYLNAIRSADSKDIKPLIEFARS